jgi:hypothetical protein
MNGTNIPCLNRNIFKTNFSILIRLFGALKKCFRKICFQNRNALKIEYYCYEIMGTAVSTTPPPPTAPPPARE